MVRNLQSRAPAPPGAASGALDEAPLGGTRAEAMRRLQMGAVGVVAVLLLIGLASIVKDRATQTESTVVAEAAAATAPDTEAAVADPLAEAGVLPDLPVQPANAPADGDAAATSDPATAGGAGNPPPDGR